MRADSAYPPFRPERGIVVCCLGALHGWLDDAGGDWNCGECIHGSGRGFRIVPCPEIDCDIRLGLFDDGDSYNCPCGNGDCMAASENRSTIYVCAIPAVRCRSCGGNRRCSRSDFGLLEAMGRNSALRRVRMDCGHTDPGCGVWLHGLQACAASARQGADELHLDFSGGVHGCGSNVVPLISSQVRRDLR